MESHRWIIPCWQLWCAVVAVYIYLDPFASVCLLQQSRNGTNQSQHGTQPHIQSASLKHKDSIGMQIAGAPATEIAAQSTKHPYEGPPAFAQMVTMRPA